MRGVDRAYEKGSLVLKTRYETASGQCEIRDGLLMREGARGHDLGVDSPHVLARYVRCLDGEVEIDVEFAPRFEYGLTVPLIQQHEEVTFARGGPMTLVVSTSANLSLEEGHRAATRVYLSAGESVGFAVEAISTWEPLTQYWPDSRIAERLDDTVKAWNDWESDHQNYEGPYREMVDLSGKVLEGLSYRPTGAMVAAPTTSLPEDPGGERNWDYRFCWVRDASFTLRALWVAACPDEANNYLEYMTAAASSVYDRRALQIMFGIEGERDLTERTLPWLRGWSDSAPVRIGNAAWTQSQHDVYGELLLSVQLLREEFGELSDTERRLLVFLADTACDVWREPDHSIWEIRKEPQHYLHSKLMCWVALDRALRIVSLLGAQHRLEEWERHRAQIRDAILEHGWSEKVGVFTQAFGSTELDAACLVIPMVGFLPYDDPRVGSTVQAIRDHLVDENGLVHRYRAEDGLEGEEGSFLLCTFWLVEVLAGLGATEDARRVFESTIGYANDLGLLSEEVDPATGRQLGNFPQAFSHVGLINAAFAISEAEGDTQSVPGIAV